MILFNCYHEVVHELLINAVNIYWHWCFVDWFWAAVMGISCQWQHHMYMYGSLICDTLIWTLNTAIFKCGKSSKQKIHGNG